MPKPNALARETSPYLLQHARQPVNWMPWGPEAFEAARREGKPVFLSVGYSACHWCHVMAQESFEDEETAARLNAHFIPIKVDREERPDVDRVYMAFVQATTGCGGWPMSVWLGPDRTPFYGGTYFPPVQRGGLPAFPALLARIAQAWKTNRDGLLAAGTDVLRRLRAAGEAGAGEVPDRGALDAAFEEFRGIYDTRNGGFGPAPKFPQPSILRFLIRHFLRSGAPGARDMALHTLRAMARGGIHDHLGGGFHRYSVDARWHVPHFEKMLYDQAQLACAYLDAFRVSRDPFFASAARGILEYTRRELTGAGGGFVSAQAADSPRPGPGGAPAEGAFYVWTQAEIVGILGAEAAETFGFAYGVEPGGNVREDPGGEFRGRNVLFAARSAEATGTRFGMSASGARASLEASRRRLFAARELRPRPAPDGKILTAWNGLAISAFALAGRALGDDGFLAAARQAADFLRRTLYDASSGTLSRGSGKASSDGFAPDYAFLIQGLLDLHETGAGGEPLNWALALQEKLEEGFAGPSGGYFDTPAGSESLPLRIMESHDGAEPAASSVSALNLLRLARLTGDPLPRERAARTLAVFGKTLRAAPAALPAMLIALDAYGSEPG